MAPIRAQDQELFTATEFALLQSSLPSEIKSLTRARLQAQMTRARRYWDKYRGLTREQHRAKKRESERNRAQPFSNVRTERKAHMLAQALSRFEKRLEQIERRDRKKTVSRGEPSRVDAHRPATQRETIRKRKQRRQAASESASQSSATRQFQKSKMRAIHGHIRAGGKRRQVKRDAR